MQFIQFLRSFIANLFPNLEIKPEVLFFWRIRWFSKIFVFRLIQWLLEKCTANLLPFHLEDAIHRPMRFLLIFNVLLSLFFRRSIHVEHLLFSCFGWLFPCFLSAFAYFIRVYAIERFANFASFRSLISSVRFLIHHHELAWLPLLLLTKPMHTQW